MPKHSTDSSQYQAIDSGARGAPDGVARRGQPPHPSPVGLSTAHISPWSGRQPHFRPSYGLRSASATFYDGGGLVCVKTQRVVNLAQSGGGLRGRVHGFSRASRRRLLRKLGEVNQAAVPLFVTLTYPAVWPSDSADWKTHFDRWCKRLHRAFPAAGLIWRLELQRRGAPHYHCLVWGADYAALLAWASRAWYECVGSGDERHLRAGVRVERIRTWRGVRSYAGKYMGKPSNGDWADLGRIWGVRYGDNIPWAEAVQLYCSDRQAARLMRYLRRYAQLRARAGQRSLTVLVDDSAFWLHRAHDLLGAQF